jgi:hypothetical protein
MPIVLNGDTGITTPSYGGTDTSEYLVPVTAFKNRILNGQMQIDQRNAGASGTAQGYTLDRWNIEFGTSGKLTWQQNAGSVTPPSGFTNYLGVTSSSAYSITASDYFNLRQAVEGLNVSDLGWGTANAQTVTISFWVRSSITGTWSIVLRNSAGNRSYPATYTVSAANTWEQKSITIAGDTSGTWLTNNGVGVWLIVGLANGSNNTTTAGAWAAGQFSGATGANSLVGTNGATFYITGVQLEKGSTATSFDYRPYGTELALCQRYCFIGYPQANTGGVAAVSTQCQIRTPFNTQMRATPTASITAGTWIISDDYTGDPSATNPTIASTNLSNAGGRVYLAGFSGLTVSRWYASSSGGTSYIIYSAEL